ncbi:MAG: (d)CMP kinase [Firmicutes bacterium]|nr:(d)CMP kinase [Bacillota bacterium]
MNNIVRIAIDGPAGAGKSTIAKIVAKDLGIDYIDTGAMYRAIALKLIRTGTDYNDGAALAAMLDATEVDFSDGHVLLDGEPAEGFIRTPEVSEMASASSAVLAIREKLVALQRAMGQRKSIVMDGRDIGTNVLKDAECKIYLDASPRVRAQRRALELQQKGMQVSIDQIEEEIRARDYRDMHREHNPLAKADDAVFVDSSDMTIEQVVETLKAIIREKANE